MSVRISDGLYKVVKDGAVIACFKSVQRLAEFMRITEEVDGKRR